MSKNQETAIKILEHLENRKARTQQWSTALRALQRRDHKDICDELANLLDGKPALGEPVADLPKTDAASKVTPVKEQPKKTA